MNKTLKKYLVSSLITFLAGFGLVFLNHIDNITVQSFSDGMLLGILFAAFRAGTKALLEFLLAKYLK